MPIISRTFILISLVSLFSLCGKAQLNGTYTIGGLNPDFTTIQSAVDSMDSVGVSGPVVFNIRDGSYYEAIFIDNIPGLSQQNHVTFQSESGDSTAVEWWSDFWSGETHVLWLYNLHDITIRGIHFRDDGNPSSNACLKVTGHRITIENNFIEGFLGTTSWQTQYGILCFADSAVLIRNNFVWAPQNGVWIDSNLPGSNEATDIITADNVLWGSPGLRLHETKAALVYRNEIPLLEIHDSPSFDIGYNYLNVVEFWGSSTNVDTARFYNNSVYSTAGTNNPSVQFQSSSGIDFFNNTIVTPGTNPLGAAIQFISGSNNRFWNNNIVKLGAGKCIDRSPSQTGIGYSDYNNLYSEGDISDDGALTFIQWQDSTGFDQNSLSLDPLVIAQLVDSLIPQEPQLFNAGKPLYYVFDDIQGNNRHALTPTLGAFEVVDLPYVDLGPDTVLCDSGLLDAGNVATSWLWSTGATTQTIPVDTAGTYWVQVTAPSGSMNDTIVVQVYASPVNMLPDSGFICSGDSLLADAGNAAYNYDWSNGDTTQTTHLDSGGVYTVLINNQGCTVVSTIEMTEQLPPNLNLGPDTFRCTGDSILLDPGYGTPLLWSTGDSVSQLWASQTGTYSVSLVDICGLWTDSVDLLIVPLPPVVITGDSAICIGDSATLMAGGASTYEWFSGSTDSLHTVSPVTATSYFVVGTDTYGCVDSAFHQVVVHALPVPSITGNFIICEGDTTSLLASNASSWLWSTNETTQQIAVAPQISQYYAVTVSDSNNCQGSDSIEVIVNPLPSSPIITQLGGDLNSSLASSYQWYDSNGPIAGATGQSYTPLANGQYWVEITDVNGCSALSDPFDFLHFGLPDGSPPKNFTLFPNPSPGKAFLNRIQGWNGNAHVNVRDQLGRLIHQEVWLSANTTCKLDLSNQVSGLYFIEVTTSKSTSTFKLVIRK